jgi:ribosomal RNA-processing protein 12
MSVVPEVVLCLKDANGKAREAAYQLLLSMARKKGLQSFVQVLGAGLGAETSHMRSASVTALSRMVFEFGRVDATFQSTLQPLLQTIMILMTEDSREVVKSVVGFIRVCITALSPEQLQVVMPDLVRSLFASQHAKTRFRAKVKIILKKLVKLLGYDAIVPYVPKDDVRLLTHMRKVDERQARRKAATRGEKVKYDSFDNMIDSDEEDSDDGRTLMTGATGFTRLTGTQSEAMRSKASTMSRASKMSKRSRKSMLQHSSADKLIQLPDNDDGSVIDMLDAKFRKRVTFASSVHNDRNSDDSDGDDDDLSVDENGRLVIPSDLTRVSSAVEEEEVDDRPSKRRRVKDGEAMTVNSKGSRAQAVGKRAKQYGTAYKSKKAGGDVKKKGQKFEPYAYVPLDGKQYSKKHRRATVESMSSVVRGKGKRKRN